MWYFGLRKLIKIAIFHFQNWLKLKFSQFWSFKIHKIQLFGPSNSDKIPIFGQIKIFKGLVIFWETYHFAEDGQFSNVFLKLWTNRMSFHILYIDKLQRGLHEFLNDVFVIEQYWEMPIHKSHIDNFLFWPFSRQSSRYFWAISRNCCFLNEI